MELFECMISNDQILPNVLTSNILINGFCHDGKVDRAGKILEFMKSKGCSSNVFNYTALVNGFFKEKRLKKAKEIFHENDDLQYKA
ncbi:hypothetical protein TB2_016642 [Malus domestica]